MIDFARYLLPKSIYPYHDKSKQNVIFMNKMTIIGVVAIAIIAIAAVTYYAIQPPADSMDSNNPEDLKLGVIYTSPLEEPWGHQLHKAIELWQDQNVELADYAYTESVAIGDDERVLRQYADAGYEILIAHSYYPSVPTICQEYPNIPVIGAGGGMEPMFLYTGDPDPNYIHIQPLTHYVNYLQGLVAGSLSQTNKIGLIDAFPVDNTLNSMNAFNVGFREVNPDAEFVSIWIESWFDPVAAKAAAESAIDAGVDTILGLAVGAEEAAKEAGVYHYGSMTSYPTGVTDEVTVSYIEWDLKPFVADLLFHWEEGDWLQWIEDIDNVAYYDKLDGADVVFRWDEFNISQEIQDLIASKLAAIESGEIVIQWLGGIHTDDLWPLLTPELIADITSGAVGYP
jgi:basic membrane lipoprotein Med (substrate-binding protein (PBP1-ABC) superfamily)